MSTPLTPGAINSPAPAMQSSNDVYARMMQSAVASAIEDVILVDGSDPAEAADTCTCGKCGIEDFEIVETQPYAKLGGAPSLYIETRSGADPLVLDELAISADLEVLTPKRNVTVPDGTMKTYNPQDFGDADGTFPGNESYLGEDPNQGVSFADMIFTAPLADTSSAADEDYLSSFDPSGFNPFDPQIDPNAILTVD